MSLRSNTNNGGKPAQIVLNGGVNERFLGSDLEAYFRSENLLFFGISRAEYERNKRLPEGFYRIRFEVLDYNRDIALSNPQVSNSSAWLLLNDPPILNLPRQEEQVRPLPQQNLVFSWTPRHTASPNAARSVEYRFELFQLIPKTRNPNDAVLTSIPIFQSTTRSTQLVYGIAEPALTLGERYAWRVQAREEGGLDLFKNRGYSEVFAFTYGEPCSLPQANTAEVLNAMRARIAWQPGSGNTEFWVEYRKKGASYWTNTSKTPLSFALLNDLEPENTYEYRVRGFCGEVGNNVGNIGEFSTPAIEQEAIACGLPQNPIDLSNQVPKENLKVGDTLQAADFDVKITKITNNPGAGRFSGEGLMVFPLANRAKVKVKFENILVNAENRFIDGRIVVVGMGIQVLSDEMIANVNALFSEIDALLAQAETTLAKLDEVLAKMEQVMEMMIKYLPDDLLQELKSSQAALELAKDEYERIKNDPNATEEQKAKAKAELKKAKEAVKKAYGDAATYWKEALVKFVKILWRATRELGQEAVSGKSSKENEKNTAQNELENIIGQKVTSDLTFLDSDTEDYTIQQKLNEIPAGTTQFLQKSGVFFKKKIALDVNVFSRLLIRAFTTEDSMKKLGDDLKEIGVDIVEFILIELKERKTEDVIVANVKIKLLEPFIQIASEK